MVRQDWTSPSPEELQRDEILAVSSQYAPPVVHHQGHSSYPDEILGGVMRITARGEGG
jgi:hypothetical protein